MCHFGAMSKYSKQHGSNFTKFFSPPIDTLDSRYLWDGKVQRNEYLQRKNSKMTSRKMELQALTGRKAELRSILGSSTHSDGDWKGGIRFSRCATIRRQDGASFSDIVEESLVEAIGILELKILDLQNCFSRAELKYMLLHVSIACCCCLL